MRGRKVEGTGRLVARARACCFSPGMERGGGGAAAVRLSSGIKPAYAATAPLPAPWPLLPSLCVGPHQTMQQRGAPVIFLTFS